MAEATPPERLEIESFVIDVDEARLAAVRCGSAPIALVMLHDGLGSIGQWRGVPSAVAQRLGVGVLAYERSGHGSSTPIPDGPWPIDWLHREAKVLDEVLDRCTDGPVVVVGHSDGGSIALLHAADHPARVRGVVAIAAHTWVEEVCRTSIIGMRQERERFERGLARHHEAPEALFEAWSGVWVSDGFRPWDIRPTLGRLDVPTLIAQGTDDAYASDDHVHASVAAIGDNAAGRFLDGLGHIAHHDDADAVVDLITDFYRSLSNSGSPASTTLGNRDVG